MTLQELVDPCVVRIKVDDGRNGTGFFVGPGRILTCNHVVAPDQTRPVHITVLGPAGAWNTEAKIEGQAKAVDLALLSIDRMQDPCVLLGPAADIADPVWTQGYVESEKAVRLEPIAARLDGEGLEVLETGEQVALMRFSNGRIVPGMSGAPLVNLKSQAVCGVVAKTLNRNTDAGGRAVPLRSILAAFPEIAGFQRAFHQGRSTWWRYGLSLPDTLADDQARVAYIQMFPLGPAVDAAIVSPDLDQIFDALDAETSVRLVQRANYLRAKADPQIDPRILTIDPGSVQFGVRDYWMRAGHQIRTRGPRMMAALYCAAPPGSFVGLEQDLLELLARLRAWPSSRGG
jgi:S1-C subfamily serine protease